ncbi:hypothetical protein [Stieleria maiorica]|uniref:hypothetical protein n=1 Tax=Stieleria maiorica TaxID=2795974 RepID=UPI0011C94CAB|nr:hypothetical protein [Stieleria maiorica]
MTTLSLTNLEQIERETLRGFAAAMEATEPVAFLERIEAMVSVVSRPRETRANAVSARPNLMRELHVARQA